MKTAILYGISGISNGYKPIRYELIQSEDFSVRTFLFEAIEMQHYFPAIEEIYLIDWRPGLKRDYQKTWTGSIESCIIFRDLLIRDGIKIV